MDSTEEAMVAGLTRQAGNVAAALEKLAKRIRQNGDSFATTELRGGATGLAADIVSDYTNGIGAPGTYLWNLVREAAELDALRKSNAAEANSGV